MKKTLKITFLAVAFALQSYNYINDLLTSKKSDKKKIELRTAQKAEKKLENHKHFRKF